MKRICLLAMAMHIVSCFTTDPSSTSSASPPASAPTALPHVVVAAAAAGGGGAVGGPRDARPPQPPRLPPPPPHQHPHPHPHSPGAAPPAPRPSGSPSPASAPAPAAPPPPPVGPPAPAARTDSPQLLGYIFDVHSPLNKHYHHDRHLGPHFDEVEHGANATNITVQVGSTANLNCRIILLQDKTVSWVRRKHGSEDMELLTVGRHTYSGDSRYNVDFQYPNNWRLQIKYTVKRDEGTYECQVSTHPPRVIQINLHINAPEVVIVDEQGNAIQDKYYEADSTIQLSCIVRHVAMTSSVVSWMHGDRVLNYDTTRGGISVRTDLMEEGANSSLSVARVNKTDAGNYTCAISQTEYATVAVHVLNGESLAELHHGSGAGWARSRPGAAATAAAVASAVALAGVAAALLRLLLLAPPPPPPPPPRPPPREPRRRRSSSPNSGGSSCCCCCCCCRGPAPALACAAAAAGLRAREAAAR